jgi:hypothetical protein
MCPQRCEAFSRQWFAELLVEEIQRGDHKGSVTDPPWTLPAQHEGNEEVASATCVAEAGNEEERVGEGWLHTFVGNLFAERGKVNQ